MLVDGVPEWPEDTQAIGNEGKSFFLIFPQRGQRVRLYLCYDFADKGAYQGADRREKVLATFGALSCLPYAKALARARNAAKALTAAADRIGRVRVLVGRR